MKNITGTRLPDILSSLRVNVPEVNFEKIVARLMSEMKATKGTEVADKIMEKNLEQQIRSYFPQLRDTSAQIRAEALKKLMEFVPKLFSSKSYDLIRLLIDRLDAMSDTEEDLGIFRKIIDGLGNLYVSAQKSQREELVQFVSKKFSRHIVRKERALLEKKHIVIRAIAELKDQNYLPELVSLLWDQGSFSEARDALIAMAEYAIPILVGTLSEADDRTVRMKIIDVLVHMGEKIVPEITKLLEKKEWFIRRNGIFILGELKCLSSIDHLGRLINDPKEKVQIAVVEALNKIDSEKIREYLKNGLSSQYRSVVIAAMKSLPREDVSAKIFEVAGWLKQRKSIPNEKEEQFRRSVIELLGSKGDDRVLEHLLGILEEKAIFKGDLIQTTKLAALNAIAQIGTEKAMNILNTLQNHKDEFIASTCRELLKHKK
ncbi:MAG: HEAT repeat domain-containing protein [bacterium]